MKELSKTSKLPAPGSLAVYHAWISAVVLIRSRILSTELWPEGHFFSLCNCRRGHVTLANARNVNEAVQSEPIRWQKWILHIQISLG
jgi:hypothetical protein